MTIPHNHVAIIGTGSTASRPQCGCRTGARAEPVIPDLPGLEAFEGARFHSARRDHGFDLTGKRVAVIGTGASAVQFVPAIQPSVEAMTVFQRTPAWGRPAPRPRGLGAHPATAARVPLPQRLARTRLRPT
jgi:cation diffusion facilitator CzcD-associated flavoprotein CzcO